VELLRLVTWQAGGRAGPNGIINIVIINFNCCSFSSREAVFYMIIMKGKKLAIMLFVSIAGCEVSNEIKPFEANKLNASWLEQIIRESDTSYSKPYFRSDFVTAHYYLNRNDSSLCQVMKDSSDNIRQIIVEEKKVRTFFAQFYPDGQAVAITPVGSNGRFEGDATVFYPDGKVKSKGKYCDGFYCGEWKVYDENGKLIKKEEYDTNGQLIKSADY
jgi:antitoxin component YwqK of YwqJK toxin-antitoxin module